MSKIASSTDNSPSLLLDVRRAAAYLSMTPAGFRWMATVHNDLPQVRFGGGRGRIFFRRADLDAWVARHTVPPPVAIPTPIRSASADTRAPPPRRRGRPRKAPVKVGAS